MKVAGEHEDPQDNLLESRTMRKYPVRFGRGCLEKGWQQYLAKCLPYSFAKNSYRLKAEPEGILSFKATSRNGWAKGRCLLLLSLGNNCLSKRLFLTAFEYLHCMFLFCHIVLRKDLVSLFVCLFTVHPPLHTIRDGVLIASSCFSVSGSLPGVSFSLQAMVIVYSFAS